MNNSHIISHDYDSDKLIMCDLRDNTYNELMNKKNKGF